MKIKSFRLFWFRSRSFPDYGAAGESEDRAFPQVFIYLRSEKNGTAPGQAWCHRGANVRLPTLQEGSQHIIESAVTEAWVAPKK